MKSINPDDVKRALETDAVAIKIMEKQLFPKVGDLIGVRLNLNVLKNTGVPVQTLHRGTRSMAYTRNKGFYHGEAIGYAGAVKLKNAFFNVHQQAREDIAEGKTAKNAMASIDGEFVEEVSNAEQGIEIRFNPREVHLFVDMDNNAIRYAEEVIVIGHRAFASGEILYHNDKTAPLRKGDFPSKAIIQSDTVRPSITEEAAP